MRSSRSELGLPVVTLVAILGLHVGGHKQKVSPQLLICLYHQHGMAATLLSFGSLGIGCKRPIQPVHMQFQKSEAPIVPKAFRTTPHN